MGNPKPLFRDLNADDPEPETTEIESLCMNCHSNGITRILLTKIPFYKELVLMSFSCEECGYQNNEIQSGAAIAEKGVRFTLKVNTPRDLNRQVVKSDYTSIKIIELDFEVPAKSQKGEVTTIEGVIDRSVSALEQDQPARREQHPEVAVQIDKFINKLRYLKDLETSFTFVLEDISGNSFIENPNAPAIDEQCSVQYFIRNNEQNKELGILDTDEVKSKEENAILHSIPEGEFTLEDLEGEVLQFPTNCPNCGSACQTNMKMTNIPHFKEVVIMATNCDVCGSKTNEVKSGSGIEEKGLKIEVDINSKDDFSRDLLKSETCHLQIPQLQFEVGPNALGGRFTTVEGLIAAIKDQLGDHKQSLIFGDSSQPESKQRFEEFLKKLDNILEGNLAVTLILDDPAGNSYIQSLRDDNEPDDSLRITHYDRSVEQNEELGIADMKTENYESS
ncbi:zinc finger protein Zpr1 [Leptinotarsa decemlineata]|uniref:zinc finger protein Zpr1 n=1 Tax=Leptinotarsa decemlineata TaxID=7539 RepID=UPI003D305695